MKSKGRYVHSVCTLLYLLRCNFCIVLSLMTQSLNLLSNYTSTIMGVNLGSEDLLYAIKVDWHDAGSGV